MNREEQLLIKLKQAVIDNLENEQFGVEHLSQIVGVSRSHLHRRLKKIKSQSISQFIREVRLAEALNLLRQDVATTSEIAYRVGFSSPSYFHKCFLDYYGYPPSEAKKISQKKPTSAVNTKRKRRSVLNYRIIAISLFSIILGYAVFYLLTKEKVHSTTEKSIAVLPFNSHSSDDENRYFADGLVEDLLNRLATIKEFKVISRTSSDTYRERGKKKAPEIASELGVSYIVEGSVQKHENKVRITVQLIDAINDDHIWIKSFDRELVDVFKVQSEIAIQVASGLSTVLTDQQTIDIQKNRTENVKAFEFYQLGRFYWGKRNPDDYESAINYFEKAISEDQSYALAYAGLGDTYFLKIWHSSDSAEIRRYRDKAEKYALKALELDEHLAEAHTVLATLYFFIDWDWTAAEKTFLRALELNPNYSTLHHRYSEHLSITGRHKEARNHINKAIELDPLSYVIRRVSAYLYFNQGLFQESISEAHICEELDKGHQTPAWNDFVANYKLDNDPAAINGFKHLSSVSGYPITSYQVDSAYEISGLEGLLRWGIELNSWNLDKAELYALLGEYDKSFDLLDEELKKGNRIAIVSFWYALQSQHSNPRFIAILKKMNLPWDPESTQ